MNIAVVIPTYNAADFIGRTLHSVFTQSILPDELIVVDDASSDNTAQTVETELKKCAIPSRLIRLPTNSGGPARPLNRGIGETKCDWIVPLDHDDELVPDRVERLKRVIPQTTNCGAVIGRLIVRPESRDREHLLDDAWKNVCGFSRQFSESGFTIVESAIAYEGLIRYSCYAMSCSAMAFPKAVWTEVGGFDESVAACIDFAFLEAALRSRPLGVIESPVAYWTWSERNLSHGVHRRVWDLSCVMERIRARNLNWPADVRERLHRSMLTRAYLLASRGEYRRAVQVLRQEPLGVSTMTTAGKCLAKAALRTAGLR